jgi:hypothetical protein
MSSTISSCQTDSQITGFCHILGIHPPGWQKLSATADSAFRRKLLPHRNLVLQLSLARSLLSDPLPTVWFRAPMRGYELAVGYWLSAFGQKRILILAESR